MRLVLGLSCTLLLACDLAPRDATAPNTDASTAPSQIAPQVSAPTPGPTATTPPTATAPPPATSVGGRFPTLDDACERDADCALFEDEIADAPPRTYACCGGCVQRAANKNWLAQFRAFCRGFSPPSCPPLGCPMPILRPTCQSGHCVALK